MQMSQTVVKDPGNIFHSDNFNIAFQCIKNTPHDVKFISGDCEEIQTNKYLLSMFSPTLRNILFDSNTLDTSHIIFLPDISTLSIRNLLDILDCGFTVTEKISNEDIKEITETAHLFSIAITDLFKEENVPGTLIT